MKTYVVTHHKNRLVEIVLTMGPKIRFNGERWIIIPKLSQLPLLIWSTEHEFLFATLDDVALPNGIHSSRKEFALGANSFLEEQIPI